ncbi:MAG TPA: hypothetical protein VGL20_13670 [Candidatus Dormibacteraeota bacterium]|jgi:hypothetical protein
MPEVIAAARLRTALGAVLVTAGTVVLIAGPATVTVSAGGRPLPRSVPAQARVTPPPPPPVTFAPVPVVTPAAAPAPSPPASAVTLTATATTTTASPSAAVRPVPRSLGVPTTGAAAPPVAGVALVLAGVAMLAGSARRREPRAATFDDTLPWYW